MIQPRVFEDARGFFFESFSYRDWIEATGIGCSFVQDCHSRSARGVLRGLHYQLPPDTQGKLVRVIAGEIFDVAVDLRTESSGFGKWVGRHLSADNRLQMWLPEGFAHGFLVLSDWAEVIYKTTNFYAPASERSIVWNDPDLAIAWPGPLTPVLSPKDADAGLFRDAAYFGGC